MWDCAQTDERSVAARSGQEAPTEFCPHRNNRRQCKNAREHECTVRLGCEQIRKAYLESCRRNEPGDAEEDEPRPPEVRSTSGISRKPVGDGVSDAERKYKSR